MKYFGANISEREKIALYLACGQRREEGGTGFPTHVKTGKSRAVTRDRAVVFSIDVSHHSHQVITVTADFKGKASFTGPKRKTLFKYSPMLQAMLY